MSIAACMSELAITASGYRHSLARTGNPTKPPPVSGRRSRRDSWKCIPRFYETSLTPTPLTVEDALAELREKFPRMYCFIDINQRGHVRYDNGEIGVTTGVVIGVQLTNEDLRYTGSSIPEAMQKVREYAERINHDNQ